MLRRLLSPAAGAASVALALPAGITSLDDVQAAVVAATGTATVDVVLDLAERVSERRRQQVRDALATARFLGVTSEDLQGAADDPFKRRILADVFTSAAGATFHEKVVGLGLVLGRALTDKAGQSSLLAQAVILGALEEPHVLALDAISRESPWTVLVDGDGEHRGWNFSSLEQELGFGELATPVIAALKAHGCLLLVNQPGEGEQWATSLMGERVLKVLREASSVDLEELVGRDV